MQIVIEIDEYLYKTIKSLGIVVEDGDAVVVSEAIMNGIPLPKGHGKLIDADELKKHKYHDNNRFENAVAVAQIDWAPTIIKAERSDEE